jgi:general stress protein 26
MKNLNQQEIPQEMLNLLEYGTFAYLCTTDKKWMPHIATIFYVFDPKTQSIYFITSPISKKFRNLSTYPQISLTIDRRDNHNPFNNEGILVRGTASPIYQFWSPELKLSLKVIEKDQKETDLFHLNFIQKYKAQEDIEESEIIFRILTLFQNKYPQFLSSPGRDVEVVRGTLERVLVQLFIINISYWRGPKFKKYNMPT